MNLMEAIKSGKRFRRLGKLSWTTANEFNLFYEYEIFDQSYELEPELEKKIEVTRDQILEAVKKADITYFQYRTTKRFSSEKDSFSDFLLKELGFKD